MGLSGPDHAADGDDLRQGAGCQRAGAGGPAGVDGALRLHDRCRGSHEHHCHSRPAPPEQRLLPAWTRVLHVPLEIAHASRAPLLNGLASNLTGKQLAKQAADVRVGYGEIDDNRANSPQGVPNKLASMLRDDSEKSAERQSHSDAIEGQGSRVVMKIQRKPTPVHTSGVEEAVASSETDERASLILGIDTPESVRRPQNMHAYS